MTKSHTTFKLFFCLANLVIAYPKHKIYTFNIIIIIWFNNPFFSPQYKSNHKLLEMNELSLLLGNSQQEIHPWTDPEP